MVVDALAGILDVQRLQQSVLVAAGDKRERRNTE